MAEGTLECARLGHGFSVEICRWVTAMLRDIYHITTEAWLMPNPLPKSNCMIKKNRQLPNLFHLQSHPRTHLRVETPKKVLVHLTSIQPTLDVCMRSSITPMSLVLHPHFHLWHTPTPSECLNLWQQLVNTGASHSKSKPGGPQRLTSSIWNLNDSNLYRLSLNGKVPAIYVKVDFFSPPNFLLLWLFRMFSI